jgi:hypothetical protein
MMQYTTLSSGSTGTHNPSQGGIPPFSHSASTGVNLSDTQANAEALARRIGHAWAIEGHKVDAWVIKLAIAGRYSDHGEKALWGVQTDLVNGMPSGLGRAKWERKYGRGI